MNPRILTCIFDLGGTVCDKYVLAPVYAFKMVFENFGMTPSFEQIRKPMGKRKDIHIQEIFNERDICKQWVTVHNRVHTKEDHENIYKEFVPIQNDILKTFSKPFPGTKNTFQYLHDKHIFIGCTTGYTRSMMNIVLHQCQKQDIFFDVTVGGDEVKNGCRPSPDMIFRNLDVLQIENENNVVKIDDTEEGIKEGLNAGCWTVGVSRYGNYMNINSFHEEKSLSLSEIEQKNKNSAHILKQAGAHFVIDSIKELPRTIYYIEKLMKHGLRPNDLLV